MKALPARAWTLALPLVVMGLAGCGGASDASTPEPSAATSSAPAEPLIKQARQSCKLDDSVFSPFATLGDAGYSITMQGSPEDPMMTNVLKVTGVPDGLIVCVLKAAAAPDSVVSQIDATRALDGMQKASWDKISATWTYHPKQGLKLILAESK
ncbi:hypothetical protein [Arthrobacter sp. UYCo732]|uniref:hypothetical protein n=1 Tax=Arthrobacter sp. UYCo732 TaxID=3156336 RepID=UPI0033997D18